MRDQNEVKKKQPTAPAEYQPQLFNMDNLNNFINNILSHGPVTRAFIGIIAVIAKMSNKFVQIVVACIV